MNRMDADAAAWVAAVCEQLRRIAGDWVDELADDAAGHVGSARVRVTMHGAYDAGKSSLLKRFLVTDGTPVPDWLRVGGAPTSASADQIDSGDLTWVDTPGTGSGNERHDALAAHALALTDAVLVVLSPQLLSGNDRIVRGLLDGTFYAPGTERPLFPPGALIIVVAQMDTAGVSPDDDLDGYHALVERKRAELWSALGQDPDDSVALVHLVAADPDQVGTEPRPVASDYSGREKWDGVAELRSDLDALAARREELRRAAGVRYWAWVAAQALGAAYDDLGQVIETLNEARRTGQLVEVNQLELEAIDVDARSKLREAVLTELATLVAPTADEDAWRTQVEERLDGAIGRWAAEWIGKLDRFARRVSGEHRVRARRPGAERLRTYLDGLLGHERGPAPSRSTPTDRILAGFDAHARSVAQAGYRVLLGMSVEDARAELTRLRYLDPEQIGRYFAGKQGLLTSAEHADLVRDRLRSLEVFQDLTPVLIELATIVATEVRDRAAERDRVELRARLRRYAGEIVDEVLAGAEGFAAWDAAVESLRDSLGRLQVASEVVTMTEQRREMLESVVGSLAALLSRPGGAVPAPAPGTL